MIQGSVCADAPALAVRGLWSLARWYFWLYPADPRIWPRAESVG
jgi:hypothetical protein